MILSTYTQQQQGTKENGTKVTTKDSKETNGGMEGKGSMNRRIAGLSLEEDSSKLSEGGVSTKEDLTEKSIDTTDRVNNNIHVELIPSSGETNNNLKETPEGSNKSEEDLGKEADSMMGPSSAVVVRRLKKGNLKTTATNYNLRGPPTRRVSFDPLALLLDASLEGELELVQRTAQEVSNPSAANDEVSDILLLKCIDIHVFLISRVSRHCTTPSAQVI